LLNLDFLTYCSLKTLSYSLFDPPVVISVPLKLFAFFSRAVSLLRDCSSLISLSDQNIPTRAFFRNKILNRFSVLHQENRFPTSHVKMERKLQLQLASRMHFILFVIGCFWQSISPSPMLGHGLSQNDLPATMAQSLFVCEMDDSCFSGALLMFLEIHQHFRMREIVVATGALQWRVLKAKGAIL
jgi:hypothetical protein